MAEWVQAVFVFAMLLSMMMSAHAQHWRRPVLLGGDEYGQFGSITRYENIQAHLHAPKPTFKSIVNQVVHRAMGHYLGEVVGVSIPVTIGTSGTTSGKTSDKRLIAYGIQFDTPVVQGRFLEFIHDTVIANTAEPIRTIPQVLASIQVPTTFVDNGCTAIPNVLMNDAALSACRVHDWLYSQEGALQTGATKSQADYILLDQLKNNAGYETLAKLFHAAVKTFGAPFHHSTSK